MSLSDLASLGSFVSGIAVFVTLVFLLLQMRQTARNQQSLIQQGRTVRHVTHMLARTEPHLSAAIVHMQDDHRTLTPSELQAYRAWLNALIWTYEDSFLQYRAGTLSAKSWEMDALTLRGFAGSATFRTEWAMVREFVEQDWRNYVDGLIRDATRHNLPNSADWIARYEQELAA